MESVKNERELLTKVRNPFIVNMRQAFQDRENLYLIMDLMPGGDLRYHICKSINSLNWRLGFCGLHLHRT